MNSSRANAQQDSIALVTPIFESAREQLITSVLNLGSRSCVRDLTAVVSSFLHVQQTNDTPT